MDDRRDDKLDTPTDDLDRAAEALKGGGEATDRELRDAQDSLDSRLEREGADQSDIGR